jgi:predicted HicB family RNase H-like nuclease
MMEYKGYTGQITSIDEEQGLLHGRVVGITDVVTFEAKTAEDLLQAFRDSVNDYLAFCAERSEEPEKPCSGKFPVRVSPELHEQAARAAKMAGLSLNAWVAEAMTARLERIASGPARRRKPAKLPRDKATH